MARGPEETKQGNNSSRRDEQARTGQGKSMGGKVRQGKTRQEPDDNRIELQASRNEIGKRKITTTGCRRGCNDGPQAGMGAEYGSSDQDNRGAHKSL